MDGVDFGRTAGDYARHRAGFPEAFFDRLLARLFHVLEDAVVLKGGLAIELRLERAWTTKDIDLRASNRVRRASGPRRCLRVGRRCSRAVSESVRG